MFEILGQIMFSVFIQSPLVIKELNDSIGVWRVSHSNMHRFDMYRRLTCVALKHTPIWHVSPFDVCRTQTCTDLTSPFDVCRTQTCTDLTCIGVWRVSHSSMHRFDMYRPCVALKHAPIWHRRLTCVALIHAPIWHVSAFDVCALKHAPIWHVSAFDVCCTRTCTDLTCTDYNLLKWSLSWSFVGGFTKYWYNIQIMFRCWPLWHTLCPDTMSLTSR
jgi:hypothetical protein